VGKIIGEDTNWFWKCFKFEMSCRQFDICCWSSRESYPGYMVFEVTSIYRGRGRARMFKAREMMKSLGKNKGKRR